MHPTQLTLWTIIERVQRRLERRGLRGSELDAAVFDALVGALRS